MVRRPLHSFALCISCNCSCNQRFCSQSALVTSQMGYCNAIFFKLSLKNIQKFQLVQMLWCRQLCIALQQQTLHLCATLTASFLLALIEDASFHFSCPEPGLFERLPLLNYICLSLQVSQNRYSWQIPGDRLCLLQASALWIITPPKVGPISANLSKVSQKSGCIKGLEDRREL